MYIYIFYLYIYIYFTIYIYIAYYCYVIINREQFTSVIFFYKISSWNTLTSFVAPNNRSLSVGSSVYREESWGHNRYSVSQIRYCYHRVYGDYNENKASVIDTKMNDLFFRINCLAHKKGNKKRREKRVILHALN